MKFCIMLILIFVGLCNAHYMDTANRNLCNVTHSDTTVTISCHYRVNAEHVKQSSFEMYKYKTKCYERTYLDNEYMNATAIDGTTNTYAIVNFDENGVFVDGIKFDMTHKDAKTECMAIYNKYKEVKNRW